MQNKEILRLDRQLRSLRSNRNELEDKTMTPRYMRPKGAPAANQSSSFRKSLINNEPFRLREAQNNRTSGILSSGSSSPKLKSDFQQAQKIGACQRSSVSFCGTCRELKKHIFKKWIYILNIILFIFCNAISTNAFLNGKGQCDAWHPLPSLSYSLLSARNVVARRFPYNPFRPILGFQICTMQI